MTKRLVLFDIDGTLISSQGAGLRSLDRALSQVFGSAQGIHKVRTDGKTDLQICHEAMQIEGLTRKQVEDKLPKVLELYLEILEEELAAPGPFVYPGVNSLLESLQEHGYIYRGLLTGNIQPGAHIKLKKFDLWRHFKMGAYGSDSENRMDLPRIAARRARECFSIDFEPSETIIIGDAIPDVRCAKGYNATCIAVATSSTTWNELASQQPDYLFASLEDTSAVLEAILNN